MRGELKRGDCGATRPRAKANGILGDSLAVELPALTRAALVRIQVPQPNPSMLICVHPATLRPLPGVVQCGRPARDVGLTTLAFQAWPAPKGQENGKGAKLTPFKRSLYDQEIGMGDCAGDTGERGELHRRRGPVAILVIE